MRTDTTRDVQVWFRIRSSIRSDVLLSAISLSIGVLVGCQAGDSLPQKRALDAVPVRIPLAEPLPAGHAEAFFRFETGGDQMTYTKKEVGLMVVVKNGNSEYRQMIASCPDPGRGSALGGGTETVLDVAICDGEYWLMSHPGYVTVVRVEQSSDMHEITKFPLAGGARAVLPSGR